MSKYSNPIFSTIAVDGEPRFFIGVVGDYKSKASAYEANELAKRVVEVLNAAEPAPAPPAPVTRKRKPRVPAPLGLIQREVLGCFVRNRNSYPNGGWLWDTPSNTRRIVLSLYDRGLLDRACAPGGRDETFSINDEGRRVHEQLLREEIEREQQRKRGQRK